MNRILKERIKSIIIIALLMTSFIQVGILWGYNQRFPISFLAGFFGSRQVAVNDDMARNELFVPFKLVVSNGDASHWVISRDNELFRRIWDEAKIYLSEIAGGTLEQTQYVNDWGSYFNKKGFCIEFKSPIKADLLQWFLNLTNASSALPSVYKIMIVPDSTDENKNELYIYNGEGRIINYSVNNIRLNNNIKPDNIDGIIDNITNDNKNTYREYTSMRDSNLDSKTVDPDILYVVSAPRSWPYDDISCTVPSKTGKMDELANILLGSEKDRYDKNIYNDKTIQFNTKYNIYKIYSDGFLEYNYLSDGNSSERGGIGDAVVNAYRFIKQINRISNSKAGIYLSSIDDSKQGYYTLSFDYEIGGMPVFTNYPLKNQNSDNAANAITIEVNSTRVLKCTWVIRDFSQSGRNRYNDRFGDLMSTNGVKYSDMKIDDINIGYVVDSKNEKLLRPLMVIEKKDSGIQTVKMPLE